MQVFQESCKICLFCQILARFAFSVRFLQDLPFLSDSCKICLFCQILARFAFSVRFLQDLHFSWLSWKIFARYLKWKDEKDICDGQSVLTWRDLTWPDVTWGDLTCDFDLFAVEGLEHVGLGVLRPGVEVVEVKVAVQSEPLPQVSLVLGVLAAILAVPVSEETDR